MRQVSDFVSRWRVGTCIPPAIFDHLLIHQMQLEDLFIVTDQDCDLFRLPEYSYWPRLKSFSWRGMSMLGFQSLQGFMKIHISQLESLDLEFRHSHWNNTGWIRGLPTSHSFDCLASLKLVFIPLNPVLDLVRLLNFHHLQALSLFDCQATAQFLDVVNLRKPSSSLKKFELVTPEFQDSSDYSMPLANFLANFQCLESLHLFFRVSQPNTLWSMLASHMETLRTVVFHERYVINYLEFGWSLHVDSSFAWDLKSCFRTILQSPNLKAIGLSEHPQDLVSTYPRRSMLLARASVSATDKLAFKLVSSSPPWL